VLTRKTSEFHGGEMKRTAILFAKANLFAIAFFGTSLSAPAQQSSAAAAESAAVSAAHNQVDQSAVASAQGANGATSTHLSEAAYGYMRPVNCELAGKLDSKSAKVGDAVVAKTRESVRAADGTIIPKGANLVGHIADVQAHSSSEAESHLGIVFDRVEWSGGHSLPIHSVIQGIAPPLNAFASGSAGDDDSLASPVGAGAGSRGMANTRGGGILGGTAGAAGSAAGNLGSNLGANTSNLGASAGGTLRTAGEATAETAGNTGAVASTGVGAATSASMGAHATGVPGVMLAGDASGSTAGTLSASRRNVHLDSGTQLTIAVAAGVSQ
jgi:hypothetical protein